MLVRNNSNDSATSSGVSRYSVGLQDEAPKIVHDGGVARHRLVLGDTTSCSGSVDDDVSPRFAAWQRLAALEAEAQRLRAQLLAA